jgi:hypothetical protein
MSIRISPRSRVATVFLAATVCLALALATLAPSAPVRASGQALPPGTTKVFFYWLPFLRSGGVALRATKPAELNGSIVSLPNVGGIFDVRSGQGVIAMGGGFSLRANHRRVIIRGIELKTRRAALYGKVGTEELKLANAAKLISRPNGIVLAQGLRLSAHAAARLNQLLRLPHFFKPCLPLAVSISHLSDQQATVIPAHRRPGVDRPDQRLDARPCLAESAI